LHRLFAVPAFALAAALACLFWSWLGRPVFPPDAPDGRLQCLSYTPYDGSSAPTGPNYGVAPGHIQKDLEALHAYTDCIRTYSSMPPQGEVVALADALGMQVYLGIWLGANAEQNEKEIAAALALAEAHRGAIKALVVGNEVMLRREMPAEQLAGIIRDVRAQSGLPVTYAENYEFWRSNPVLADAVDFMAVHILPHWDDPAPVSIDDAQAHVRHIILRVQETFPGRPMIIGEIGWPSAGRTRGAAVPSPVNQARFIRELVGSADGLGVAYNLIEAIDQGWKRRTREGTVGGYWGVLDAERTLKFPLTGPVRAWPRWWGACVLSLLVTAGVVLWGLLPGRRLSPGHWLALGLLGQVLGSTLVLQAAHTATISAGAFEIARGGLLSLLSVAAFALVCLPRIGAVDRARIDAVPARLDVTLGWLRRPARGGLTPDVALGLVAWPTLMGAALAALLLAVDGRHRDFLVPEFWLLAALLLYHWLRSRRRRDWRAGQREAGWLALLLVLVGPFAWDGPFNREALAWVGICIALALPWLGAAREALRAAPLDPGEPQ
jgi:exo-beta-1,3-glucanase (GH17 family)